MKAYTLIFPTLLFSLKIFSQVTKVYQTENGKATDNPKKAAFYYLLKKGNDTDYSVDKFNMADKIVFKGNFKDQDLKIPNGKFSFYSTTEYINLNTGVKTIDTNRFVFMIGCFLNGVKTGQWITYDRQGRKRQMRTYKNNRLNGLYQEYNVNGGQEYIFEEGNFVDGKREGNVNIYYYNNPKPTITYVYIHDQEVGEVLHNKPPKPSDDFDKYLEKATDPFFDYLKSESLVVKMLVNEIGKVDSVLTYNESLNQDVLDKVNRSLINSPEFEPGIQNDIPNKQIYIYNFKFGSSYYKNTTPYKFSQEFLSRKYSEALGSNIQIGFWKNPKN